MNNNSLLSVFGRIEPTREKHLQKYTSRPLVDTVLYKDRKGTELFAIFPLTRFPWNKKTVMVNCWRWKFSWIKG